MRRLLWREWHTLARMRTAIILLAIVGTLSVIATELPQRALQPERATDYINTHRLLGPFFDQLGLFSVYESWPLLLAVVLMYVSLSNCVITRGRALFRRWRRRLPRNAQFIGEAGSLVFHLSFFVLLAGVAYNLAGGFTAFVNVIEGDSVVESRSSYDQVEEGLIFNPNQHRGYEVKLDRFNASYYTNGKPSDFVSHVEVLDQGRKVKEQDIRVNEYMAYRDVKFYQANYGWAPVLQVTTVDGRKVFDAPVIFFGDQSFANGVLKVPAAGPPGEQLGARMFFAPDVQGDALNAHAGSANLVDPAVSFAFFKGDLHSDRAANVYDIDVTAMKQIWTGAIRLGETAVLPDGSRVTFARVARYSGFQVTYAPGLPIIYTAFVLMLGGLLVRLYLRPLIEWRARRRAAPQTVATPGAGAASRVGTTTTLDQGPSRSSPG